LATSCNVTSAVAGPRKWQSSSAHRWNHRPVVHSDRFWNSHARCDWRNRRRAVLRSDENVLGGGDHVLHLRLAAKEQFDHEAVNVPAVLHHRLPRILVGTECDKRIALLSADDVNTTVGDRQALEETPNIERVRIPRKILQSYDNRHFALAVRATNHSLYLSTTSKTSTVDNNAPSS